MIKYKKGQAVFQEDNTIEIPDNAIAIKSTLVLTKPFKDPDCKMVNGVTYLIPEEG